MGNRKVEHDGNEDEPIKINANASATLAVERFKKAISLNPVTTPEGEHYRETLMEDGRDRGKPGS
ncbi:hypothetical protein SY88_05840 [Clostridiales bacterium PH28_bin88]|nr:hypothetical protein SY88_05840 [Clostridiales bacterium PH28_bin88]